MSARARGLAALAAVAAACVAAAAGTAPARPAGTVSFVAGEATRTADGRTARLSVGALVHEGDRLETGRRTRLEVKLADGSVLRLGPGARLDLETAAFGREPGQREVSARLRVGDVWAKVAKAALGEGRFEVTTENAVAGVRGTTFRVDAAQDRSVVVKVYGGTVAVAAGAVPRPSHAAPGAERRPVPGPAQVTRDQWERIVGRMMEVRVSADGTAAEPRAFTLAPQGGDDFERWNLGRDAAMEGEGDGPAR